jgi:hypothetical protein
MMLISSTLKGNSKDDTSYCTTLIMVALRQWNPVLEGKTEILVELEQVQKWYLMDIVTCTSD